MLEVDWKDGARLGALAEHYRRELHVHCYRMLGSFDDAEELVQETLLRGWRQRHALDDPASLRPWLYRIATNHCLDFLRRATRRAVVREGERSSNTEVPWLQPYPDRLLYEAAPHEAEPEGAVVARETMELGFLTAIQLLPAKQRAALLLSDVVGWPAVATAAALETTVASVNSALQRARATLKARRPVRDEARAAGGSEEEQAVLRRYIDAIERSDGAAFLAALREDVRCSMPPAPVWFEGRGSMGWMVDQAFGPDRVGDWRCLPTWANGRPAAACYLRGAGDSAYRPFSISVLRIEGGAVAEITAFTGEAGRLFKRFGLLPAL